MKKFWSIFTVALVALSAVSCGNIFEDEATIKSESLSFVVNIDNTRTALEQDEKGWNTVWVGDETLVVTSGDNTFNFTNTVENKNKFTCEAVGVRSLIGSPAKVYYNNVINSAAGAAGMSLTGATEAFSESVAIELSAVNAFLKLTSAEDVTLTLSTASFGDGEKGINSIVVKGESVLVPVCAAKDVTLTATIADVVVKEAVLTFENNKIYNLGTLEAAPATINASFNAVDGLMDPSMHSMPGVYLLNLANTATNDFAMLLFYDNSNPFIALYGEYPVAAGMLGGEFETPCLIADPMYCQLMIGGETYFPVSGSINVITEMPSKDNNGLEFNMVVEDAAGKQYNLVGDVDNNMIGAIGYGPSYIDFNLVGWGYKHFEASYDENNANIVKLKSSGYSGDFVMELATENGDITSGAFSVLNGTLSGYYFDALDAADYVFDGGQISFEKGETENDYILFVSTRAGDWTMGGKYKIVAPENGYEITINFPVAEPVLSEYGVVGSFQGWDVANPVKMYSAADGWDVATGVELYKDDEIKIVKGTTWDVSFGPSEASVLAVDAEHTLVSANSQNVKIAKNGKFDVYFNATSKKFKYTCTEEYTDLNVTITVDNKANWSPLYIILKDGENLITPAEGALVENNKYTISGDYIGSSLTYQFVSGDKQSDPAFVTISKNGATVTLEENVVKLYFQLDTANAKQWWGNTSKIHVWNTNTSFDTSWPGTTMTSEGNYTWSVVVPSELVGKTINFLVHNGNGWQSKDSKVTIKAEGVTVTGSSIGIN